VAEAAAAILVNGRVQGVGFRYYCYQQATQLGLVGWVKNNRDGSVSAWAQGSKTDIDQLVGALKDGPTAAYVQDVDVDWRTPDPSMSSFDIAR